MASGPLTSNTELAARLGEEPLRVIDCSFDLADPSAGEALHVRARIPGARHAHLDRDLSDLSRKASAGRHPLPGLRALSASLSRLGIDRHSHVVAYDQGPGMYAARLWWLLRSCGYRRVQVLDGGMAAWQAADLPVESGTPVTQRPSRLPEALRLAPRAVVDAEDVSAGLGGQAILLLDARAAPRFRGEVEPLDPVAGHIPGAINRPFADNLAADGRFKTRGQLREEYTHLLGGRRPSAVVHMCGSGVTACHNKLAMDIAGLRGSRVYADSWSGWITDPERPVTRGA
jgi:thiosulfate/3-mercaptopyruvate sulfurtransferase